MKNDIKIALIGGTGKSGKYLVRELISRKISFNLLVRNPEKQPESHPLIDVIQGNVRDYETVRKLTEGCQAVISTLGLGQPPSETSIFSISTSNIIRAMKVNHIQRYIVITGLNVDTPYDKKSQKTKLATNWMYTNFPLTTTDKQKEYNILKESDLSWTMVRLPLIEQTEVRANVAVDSEDCPGDRITAADLADFLIGQVFDDAYIRMAPFLANK
jgi:putative NADH-flavin reductase